MPNVDEEQRISASGANDQGHAVMDPPEPGPRDCGKQTIYSLFTSLGYNFVNRILFMEV